ncbi:hypothetical protein HZS_7529 [Henneguya salminicola]|nr:hypothetical protein HZS_7529 [Henneguya salminicola]
MPFVKRTVQPEYLCRNSALAGSQNVLQDQNKFVWINYLKQISSISTHMSEMFDTLDKNIQNLGQRSQNIESRLGTVNRALPNLKFPPTELSSPDGYIQCSFQIEPKLDNASLAVVDMPAALKELYNSCLPMPNFQILDKYRTDGLKSSDKYSNPGFFFESWLNTVEQDYKARKDKKKRQKRTAEPVSSPAKKAVEIPKSKQRELAQKHEESNKERIPGTTLPQVPKYEPQPTPRGPPKLVQPIVSTPPVSLLSHDFPPAPPDTYSGAGTQSPDNVSISTIDLPLPHETEFAAPPAFDNEVTVPITLKTIPEFLPPPSHVKETQPSLDFLPPPPPPPPPPPVSEVATKVTPVQPTIQHKEPPKQDTRVDLLSSIRSGKNLRKVDQSVEKKSAPGFGDEVYAILAKKIAAVI